MAEYEIDIVLCETHLVVLIHVILFHIGLLVIIRIVLKQLLRLGESTAVGLLVHRRIPHTPLPVPAISIIEAYSVALQVDDSTIGQLLLASIHYYRN